MPYVLVASIVPLWSVDFGSATALQDNFYVVCHKLPVLFVWRAFSSRAPYTMRHHFNLDSKTNRLVVLFML